MAQDFQIQLELTAKDNASAAVNKAAKETEKAFKQAESAAKQSGTVQAQAAQQGANAVTAAGKRIEQSYRNARKTAAELAQAREILGVRSENAVQREIAQTRAAYDRLKRSGVVSHNELKRAAEATQQRIKALNAELGKTSFGDKMRSVGRGLASGVAGVVAGGATLAAPVRNQMSFDRQLAMVANTAFSDRDVNGRIAGKKELFGAVQKAVAEGGGTKEEALSSLDTLLASGTVSAETAMNLLPTLQKGAVATGASPEDMAKIAISAMQQFGIKEQDIGKVLDMAVAAGQAGNFELKDMARWLPQQMAAAKSLGMNGLGGFEALLVANQQARVTAGTSDQAGNNLANLLAKVNATETTDRLQKLEYKDKNGKVKSIDYLKSMEHYKSKGQNSLQAFMSIMDDVVGNDANYKELSQRIKTAKGEEQQKLLKEMADIVQSSAIGQVISDRETIMALLGIRNNVELGKSVREDIQKSEGAVEKSHAVVRDTNDYKVEDLKNTAEFSQMKNFEQVNNALGFLSEQLTSYGKEYPNLTQFLMAAKDAVVAFTAALAASSLMDLLIKTKASPGLMSKAGDVIRNGVKTAATAVSSGVSSVATGAGNAVRSMASGGAGLFSKLGVIGFALTPTEANKGEQEAIDARMAKMRANGDAPALNSVPSIGKAVGELIQTIPNLQGVIGDELRPKIDATSGALANYQADFNSFGQTLSTGIEAGLAAQSHTLANHIVVEVDGRAIAEQVSEQQFNFNKRMA